MVGIQTDLRLNDHDGKKKMKDPEMGTNGTVGMKKWKERKIGEGERWADMGRHRNGDRGGGTEDKRDGWNKTGQNGKEMEKKQERQRK